MADNDITERIIDYIRRNRVSTTEVADCLGKSGALPGLQPINRGQFCVGPISWIYAYEETNWPVHEQIESIGEGTIVICEAFDCNGRGVYGDIVAKYLLLYKQSTALVVNGNLRDAHRLIKEGWPIWCSGFNPVGCLNREPSAPFDPEIIAKHRKRYEAGLAVCDDTGVVVIPKEELTTSFIEKLEFIEEQEDIWYECIDRRKWSTFKTICLKEYENDGSGD